MTARGGRFLRRRGPRPSPMQLRIGRAARSGAAAALPYPGLPPVTPSRSPWRGGLLSALLHGTAVAFLAWFAWTHPPLVKEPLPVQLIKETPPPPKPKPEVAKKEEAPPGPKAPELPPKPKAKPEPPAPAQKVIAERRSVNFAPQAQALPSQIVNPSVIAPAAPVVAAKKVDMSATGTVVAPKEIAPTGVTAERVSAVTSIATATPSRVDLGSASAPALRGPTDATQPAGPSVGPRQITNTGGTVGTGTVSNLPSGSSVREGIASNRDVLGSPTGPRLANVNSRVGEGLLRGDGGDGTGQGGGGGGGGGDGDCLERPEVGQYIEQVKQRMYARWVLPPDVPGNQAVQLRFQLDVAGSVRDVRLVSSGDARLGESAVEALRAAAPFPPMNDRVRCVAQRAMNGTFRNPSGG